MSAHSKIVEEFVAAVRRRLNLHQLWTTLIWAVTAAAALSIVVGLCYVLRGYAVPGLWIGSICAAVFICSLGVWILQRMNVDRVALLMDRIYQLQDAVSSYLHFASQGRRDGYYELQAQQTVDRVSKLDSNTIRYKPPKRLLCCALGLLAVAIPISLASPSDAVVQQLAMEKKTEEETKLIKEELLKEADKLREETLDKEEEKLLDPNKVRRWVEELKTTKDRAEALRQYAKLDRKLKDVRKSLERKEEEQLLERAAAELAKGEETKPLADTLEKKDYDKAAGQLKDLKPNGAKSPEQQRRDAAKLKAAAQRMALASQTSKSLSRNNKSATAKPSENSNSSNKQSKGEASASSGNKPGGANDSSDDGDLSEMIDELAKAAEDLDKSDQDKDSSSKCQKCCSEKVDKLADKLKKLAICKRADCKLSQLCQKCGECQSVCSSPNAGGLKAGWGSNTDRRSEKDPLVDNGQTTQLKGLKGAGPSLTTVEAAESGSGVSNRSGTTARELKFKHQFESFVQREDVPEDVKDGVKRYFEIIHETDSDISPKKDSKE